MNQMLEEQYGFQAHPKQLYRARWIAREENEGTHSKSFLKLCKYRDMMIEKNPGTSFGIQFENENVYGQMDAYGDVIVHLQFKRVFACFDACKGGFLRGCRPFIGLDGCHLKGPYSGVLLSAISIDGNNGIFPLAYVVVESEGKDSCLFFLYELRQCIRTDLTTAIAGGFLFTFMTDKQKGLIDAMGIIFPEANHRYCARHLDKNFKSKWGGGTGLRSYFWAASKAYTKLQFDMTMNGMKTVNKEAHDWLMKNPPSMWRLTPNEEEVALRRMLDIVESLQNKFEVLDGSGVRFVVNLTDRTCDCGVWVATGLPCRHAGACIHDIRGELEDYCDSFFYLSTYVLANEKMIEPCPDINSLEDIPLLAPKMKRKSRRPKKDRRRKLDEEPKKSRKSKSNICPTCKGVGHNIRTCKGGPVKGNSSSHGVGMKRKERSETTDDISSSQRVTRSSQHSSVGDEFGELVEEQKIKMMACLCA
ncbi:uncharacterized protein LOC122655944 [Telopea speciosissima]|uniref:uncharacterized protein LOC122655944 n=1 Tax=Telopea speciosissima TaxID=54955 RepID=UPI001CC56497|nr:uncharacterized protein LOC122655944 [Telopea speciosissima]